MDGSQPNSQQQITFPLDPASIQILMQALSISAGGVISVNTKTGVVTLSTADIADSTNKRYVTDAELTVIGNTSGTNTGDQTDATLSTSDVTTNNVSTSKHGFAPKAPNDATKFLDGTGAYSVPSGGAGGVASTFLIGSGGGQYTTTSASLVDVDGTHLKGTVTGLTIGHKLHIRVYLAYTNNTNSGSANVQLTDLTNSAVAALIAGNGNAALQALWIESIYVAPSTSIQFSLQWNIGANGTSRIENASSSFNATVLNVNGSTTSELQVIVWIQPIA